MYSAANATVISKIYMIYLGIFINTIFSVGFNSPEGSYQSYFLNSSHGPSSYTLAYNGNNLFSTVLLKLLFMVTGKKNPVKTTITRK